MSIEMVTLKKFRKFINDAKLDKYENLPVVASSDDEGNSFNRILSLPTYMVDVEVYNDDMTFKKAICIN